MNRTPTMGPKTILAAQLRAEGLSLSQIAARMGIGGTLGSRTARVANFLAAARRHAEGTKLPSGRPPAGAFTAAQPIPGDEQNDKTPGCARCGLRGEHVCLPATAVAYLRKQDEAA